MLESRQMAEVFGIGSLRFKSQRIIFKDRNLVVTFCHGDSAIGRIAAFQKIWVIP